MTSVLTNLIHLLQQHVPAVPTGEILQHFGSVADKKWLEQAAQYVLRGGQATVKPAPLNLVFQEKPGFCYPMQPLALTQDAVFPVAAATAGSFETLTKFFHQQLETLAGQSGRALEESLISLVRRSFSNCAVSEQHSKVSLAEYLRLTAALAQALERAGEAENPLLFASAGIDGIQEFCFDLMSNKAAKSMKGRSFYLQILMDAVVQRLLREESLGATSAHLIYARGGKMQLVLANTPEARTALANIRTEIEATIFDLHKTGLHLWLLDDLAFNLQDVNSGQLWKTLDQKTAYLKGRTLETQLVSNFTNLFEPIEEGFEPDELNQNSPKICSASGDFIAQPNEKENRLNDTADEKGEDPIWVSGIVKQQAKLGKNLQDAVFYAFPDFPQKKFFRALLDDALPDESIESCLYDEKDLSQPQNIKKLKGAFVKTLNLESPKRSANLTDAAIGYQFYGGNKQAWNAEAGRAKQLHELADFDETRPGAKFSRLGVLRMDLDGLGDFLLRAQANNPHFGFNATVSARLDLFLSGWLNKIRGQSAEFQDWLNITFVGGDDLMAVGHWQACFDFAEAVRADADRYFNGAEPATGDWSVSQPFMKEPAAGFTMSAGVSLVGPKFPIAKATAMAGDALDAAKNFHKNKNAFNLLGESLSWNGEFDWVKNCKTQLLDFLNGQQINASFIQQLQLFQTVKNQHLLTERQPDLSFIWHSIYFLSRYEQRMKADNPAKPFVLALRKELLGAMRHNCRMYDLLAVAARWAELEKRSQED